ncbi:MAG: MFS transporter [Rudaea sp.]|uniref:MFS transporter n=1 Tax=Rudaea sp. TaxID=2136325 RepID=UPI0039E6F499
MATTIQGSAAPLTREHVRVIGASSLGTVFEWYDFYLYGSLGAVIATNFFTGFNPTTQLIFTWLAFAAGFAVRPFGALVFGRLGDLIGRKYTFLITIVIMGLSTALVGFIPVYKSIGMAAPIILISLRLLQGLALGGEYGGAATYVAEHAPPGKRGVYTSWIQTTATLGLFLSLIVLLVVRNSMSAEAFAGWGWRVPFWISIGLLVISIYIRMQLHESPLFQQMKAEGKGSKSPIIDSFGNWANGKIVLLALLGATAGEAVVWYGGQFYVRAFLLSTLKVDSNTADILVALALLVGSVFFVVFGALSDRIGRKGIVMAGCLLAALTYFPVFKALTHYANPALEAATAANPITVTADPANCSPQFDPVGASKFTSSCDVLVGKIVKAGVSYTKEAAPAGTLASVKIGGAEPIASYDATAPDAKEKGAEFNKQVDAALKAAGYPAKADDASINKLMVFLLVLYLVILVTMVYGPIAAWLVELFPTRIRYTSMSLPYHIGNGWFGGFLPATAFALVASSGNQYQGLWYPVIVAAGCFVIGSLFLPETKDVDITK